MGNDEQLSMDLGVEQTEWGKWVDPQRREAQARKFMEYAGIEGIPAEPWPEDSPEVKRLNPIVAELFPDRVTAATATDTADMVDAFICFIGECFIKFAGAEWVEYKWFGREHSFYEHVNPALLFDTYDEDLEVIWGLIGSMIEYHPEEHDGMFSKMASIIREYVTYVEEKRHGENRTI
ncbi:hypothetical protein [Nocardia arthritidis]|uniref:Uncharacterized protein n=1 Tax=Nocardia arthritidis TaxID=228602 RepID=A0A6G9Y4X7_9NOCA|nr:hypothetical protein [Nocardia arthritidis]QIS08204.1 hypothetical protein F5544_01405 [Nocardia arthritidis]